MHAPRDLRKLVSEWRIDGRAEAVFNSETSRALRTKRTMEKRPRRSDMRRTLKLKL